MAEIREDKVVCSFTPYIVVLGDCLVQLRRTLQSEFEYIAAPTNDNLDFSSIDEETRARISSLLETVRRAQFLVGRPCDDAPDWLDIIIEGE